MKTYIVNAVSKHGSYIAGVYSTIEGALECAKREEGNSNGHCACTITAAPIDRVIVIQPRYRLHFEVVNGIGNVQYEHVALPDYARRLVQELKDLNEKMQKLRVFEHTVRFKELDRDKQIFLYRQEDAMREYADILVERIESAQNKYAGNAP